jgi:dTDP-4-amino-4,6-dideoxygalactose transaminase
MKDEVIGRVTDSSTPSFLSFIFPPSSFPRVPLAVPYWTSETYRTIFHSLISGRVVNGPQVDALRAEIVETLGVADARLCGSGSLALELALRACGVRVGDEVVIPTFCCSAVVPPIVAVGAVPVLADVGAELNLTAETVSLVLTRKTKAIIVPHLFGNPAEIGAIVELACEKNIRVIDDAAQALGATIDGQAVGSFGDAGILSFGAEKVCFGLGGGAVVSQRRGFLDNHAGLNLTLPPLVPMLRKCLLTLFWRRWRGWTLPIYELIYCADARDPEAPPSSYRKEQLVNLNAAVALSLVESLHANIETRRARVQAYGELLGDLERLELIRHGPGSACLTQVVRVAKNRSTDDLASTVIEALRSAGYEIQGSYVPMHRLSYCSMCVWDNLTYADNVWPELIELPCEPDVSLKQVEQIAAIVKAIIIS